MSKRNQSNKRRAIDSIAGRQRIPKTKLRVPRMTGASTYVQSRYVVTTANVTGTGTQSVNNVLVNPPSYSGSSSSNDAGGNVLVNYQEYKMQRGAVTYTPTVGSTTAGIVYIAYFDNPEIIRNINTSAYSTSNTVAIVKNSPNVVSGPVWQSLHIPMGMRIRRPKYSIDTAGTSSVETTDRCVHGLFCCVVDGVTQAVTTTYGVLTFEYAAEGFGLQNNNITTL